MTKIFSGRPIVWIAASLAFKFYLQHFAVYSAMFGSIGSGIALLLYVQISAAVLLFGAEVNAVWAMAKIPGRDMPVFPSHPDKPFKPVKSFKR